MEFDGQARREPRPTMSWPRQDRRSRGIGPFPALLREPCPAGDRIALRNPTCRSATSSTTSQHSATSSTRFEVWAFTLIELLAVIAIIGLLSGLVVGLSGVASTKSREARIRAEHAKLLSGIESYKSELGNFPPDNPNKGLPYLEWAGKNSLFYELSGALFSNGVFVVVARNEAVNATDLTAALGVKGVENSSRTAREIPFKGINFKGDQYKELNVPGDVEVLAVPIKGPFQLDGKLGKINPWFYDCTSTNRHNSETFDLWTEYSAGNQKIKDASGNFVTVPRTNVFGNWKE